MFEADHCFLPALEDGIQAVQVDSPVHIAGMVVLVPFELVADNRGFETGNRVVAGSVQ